MKDNTVKKFFSEQYHRSQQWLLHDKRWAFLKKFFHRAPLWTLDRYTVSTAVSIGLFIGYLPIPGHMIMAGLLAIAFEANLPIAVGLVWISNPFTIPPMFYFAYRVGVYCLHTPPEPFVVQANYQWFLHEFEHLAFPLLVGSLLCGSILAILGNLGVRLYYSHRS